MTMCMCSFVQGIAQAVHTELEQLCAADGGYIANPLVCDLDLLAHWRRHELVEQNEVFHSIPMHGHLHVALQQLVSAGVQYEY
jgi:hypothetical protein